MNSQLLSRRYGDLFVLERPAVTTATVATVVLAHGFGANAFDLAPLADQIDPDRTMRWLFPQAPTSLAEAAGQTGIAILDDNPEVGRAWFPRTSAEISAALTGNYFGGIAAQDPPTLAVAAEELLAATSEATGGSSSLAGVVLGGFSQGAMVATEAVLRGGGTPDGLVVLSGNPVAFARWKELAASYQNRHDGRSVRYFQSHGTSDPLLSYQNARNLNEMLTGAGFIGEFHHFPGGHWIPNEVIWPLSEFLLSM